MSTGPLIQHFSVPRGDSCVITLDVDPDTGIALYLNSQAYFTAWLSRYGVAYGDPVIRKAIDHGMQVQDPDQLVIDITFTRADTVDLTAVNYNYEIQIVDPDGNHVTPTKGIMTLTGTDTANFEVDDLP